MKALVIRTLFDSFLPTVHWNVGICSSYFSALRCRHIYGNYFRVKMSRCATNKRCSEKGGQTRGWILGLGEAPSSLAQEVRRWLISFWGVTLLLLRFGQQTVSVEFSHLPNPVIIAPPEVLLAQTILLESKLLLLSSIFLLRSWRYANYTWFTEHQKSQ